MIVLRSVAHAENDRDLRIKAFDRSSAEILSDIECEPVYCHHHRLSIRDKIARPTCRNGPANE